MERRRQLKCWSMLEVSDRRVEGIIFSYRKYFSLSISLNISNTLIHIMQCFMLRQEDLSDYIYINFYITYKYVNRTI